MAETTRAKMLTSYEVCERTGCTYRELDFWVQTGVVSPTVASRGSGSRRLFDESEVVWIATVTDMRRAGVDLTAIREAVERGKMMAMLEDLERRIELWRGAMPEWASKPLKALA